MSEYICTRKCFHKGRLFKPGDKFAPKPEEKVPHHFASAEKYVERVDQAPRLGTKINPNLIRNPSVKAPGKDKEPTKPKGKEE
ncbi:MAG: hypothetical protein ABFD81_09695 [Syntrophaceae bacterium]|jgi:hypothetical protein